MRPEGQLLTIAEAAEMLGLRKTDLAYMRRRGTGPVFLQFSARNIRYRQGDIALFQHQPKRAPEPPCLPAAKEPVRAPKPLSNCTLCNHPDTPVLKTGKCLCSSCITDTVREKTYGTNGKDMWTGRCHICCCELYMGGQPYREGVRLAMLDHCHTSGIVRGWLCGRCNTLLGKLKDDPQLFANVVAYLTTKGMFS